MSCVLLVNDDESIMGRTARMLEEMGWEVHTASARKAALWTCVARQPRLVIIDIEMRDGKGLELISTIRRIDKNLFILAVTRDSYDDMLLEIAEASGANQHVIGPVSAPKLFVAIETGRANGFL